MQHCNILLCELDRDNSCRLWVQDYCILVCALWFPRHKSRHRGQCNATKMTNLTIRRLLKKLLWKCHESELYFESRDVYDYPNRIVRNSKTFVWFFSKNNPIFKISNYTNHNFKNLRLFTQKHSILRCFYTNTNNHEHLRTNFTNRNRYHNLFVYIIWPKILLYIVLYTI